MWAAAAAVKESSRPTGADLHGADGPIGSLSSSSNNSSHHASAAAAATVAAVNYFIGGPGRLTSALQVSASTSTPTSRPQSPLHGIGTSSSSSTTSTSAAAAAAAAILAHEESSLDAHDPQPPLSLSSGHYPPPPPPPPSALPQHSRSSSPYNSGSSSLHRPSSPSPYNGGSSSLHRPTSPSPYNSGSSPLQSHKITRTVVAADNDVSNGFVKDGKMLPYVFEANDAGIRKRTSKILPVCGVCGKKFVCVTTMKRHLVTHTGEKPFACKVCGKQYTQKGNLRVHERTHRNDRPFECNICHQKFYRKEPMQKHQWRQHGVIHYKSRPAPCGNTPNGIINSPNVGIIGAEGVLYNSLADRVKIELQAPQQHQQDQLEQQQQQLPLSSSTSVAPSVATAAQHHQEAPTPQQHVVSQLPVYHHASKANNDQPPSGTNSRSSSCPRVIISTVEPLSERYNSSSTYDISITSSDRRKDSTSSSGYSSSPTDSSSSPTSSSPPYSTILYDNQGPSSIRSEDNFSKNTLPPSTTNQSMSNHGGDHGNKHPSSTFAHTDSSTVPKFSYVNHTDEFSHAKLLTSSQIDAAASSVQADEQPSNLSLSSTSTSSIASSAHNLLQSSTAATALYKNDTQSSISNNSFVPPRECSPAPNSHLLNIKAASENDNTPEDEPEDLREVAETDFDADSCLEAEKRPMKLKFKLAQLYQREVEENELRKTTTTTTSSATLANLDTNMHGMNLTTSSSENSPPESTVDPVDMAEQQSSSEAEQDSDKEKKELVECQCKTCGNVFCVTDPYNFKCSHCNVKYTSLPTHMIADPLQCIGCCQIFPHKPALKNHQVCSDKERPFICCKCGYGFRQKAHLQKHQWRIHRRKLEPENFNKDGEVILHSLPSETTLQPQSQQTPVFQQKQQQSQASEPSELSTITMQDIIDRGVERSMRIVDLKFDNNDRQPEQSPPEQQANSPQPLDLSPTKPVSMVTPSQQDSQQYPTLQDLVSSSPATPPPRSPVDPSRVANNPLINQTPINQTPIYQENLISRVACKSPDQYPAWKKQRTSSAIPSNVSSGSHQYLPPISTLQKPTSSILRTLPQTSATVSDTRSAALTPSVTITKEVSLLPSHSMHLSSSSKPPTSASTSSQSWTTNPPVAFKHSSWMAHSTAAAASIPVSSSVLYSRDSIDRLSRQDHAAISAHKRANAASAANSDYKHLLQRRDRSQDQRTI